MSSPIQGKSLKLFLTNFSKSSNWQKIRPENLYVLTLMVISSIFYSKFQYFQHQNYIPPCNFESIKPLHIHFFVKQSKRKAIFIGFDILRTLFLVKLQQLMMFLLGLWPEALHLFSKMRVSQVGLPDELPKRDTFMIRQLKVHGVMVERHLNGLRK